MTDEASSKSTTPRRLAKLLREDIFAGAIAPGAPLREEDLAKAHNVSRHVIRETLRLLAADGLAEYLAFKGARVSFVSVDDVKDIYQTRRFFELSAIASPNPAVDLKRLALVHGQFAEAVAAGDWTRAYELDIEFHATLIASASSRRVETWHRGLFQALSLAHLVCPQYREQGLTESVSEHAAIIIALMAGDGAGAAGALKRHLDHAEALLSSRMTNQPDEPKKPPRAARASRRTKASALKRSSRDLG